MIKVPIDKYGTSESAILHLPDDYGKTSTRYPILVFLHGMGEGGTNPAKLYNNSNAGGPSYWIARGKFPSSVVNPADGKSYKFIIVSPQSTNGWSTTAAQLDFVLTSLLKTYRVDTSRVYLTGLSAGGEGVLEYVGKRLATGVAVNATYKIAAFIPMSAVMNAFYRPTYAEAIVKEDTHIWGFGSPTDVHGSNTLSLVTWDINTMTKAKWGISTSYEGGHCCWGQFYNPEFKQNGMNIYEWALQYTKGASASPAATAPPVTVPKASAGTDQTTQLPVSQVTLNGAASAVTNGTIAKYAWTQQSGPSPAAIASPSAVSTVVTRLSAGVYSFALTITDNTGKTSTDAVQVTVKAAAAIVVPAPPPAAYISIPGKVDAVSFNKMSGIATEVTTDIGGGRNVGWIDQGDWVDYNVDVATAGTYTVNFRIATPYAGAGFQLKSGSGSVLTTVKLNPTGSFQAWGTVTAVITLPAGKQTLQLYSNASPQWNLNWMQFTSGALSTLSIPGTIQAESYNGMFGVETQSTSDAGGGRNVGWIDQGDWMDYPVNVASAGSYTVNFRVATPNAGASFQLKSGSGSVLTTVKLNSTGSFQEWVTASATIVLPAGRQTLQIYSDGSPQWNLNWMQFTSGAVSALPIPGTIQAENYSGMFGIETQSTPDAGGGRNVGWIDRGDWMDYPVNVASAGTYSVTFRVATPYQDNSLQLQSEGGSVLATVKVPVTGGWQNYKTINVKVKLAAGNQTLRLSSNSSGSKTGFGWNINWMQFVRKDTDNDGSDAATISSQHVTMDTATDTLLLATSFGLYPNPVRTEFNLQLNNRQMGDMLVQVIDAGGVVRHVYKFNKNQSSILISMSAADLPVGTYFIRVQIGTWSEVKKILKL